MWRKIAPPLTPALSPQAGRGGWSDRSHGGRKFDACRSIVAGETARADPSLVDLARRCRRPPDRRALRRIRYGYPAMGGTVGASMATGFFALERFVLRRNAGGSFLRCRFWPISGSALEFSTSASLCSLSSWSAGSGGSAAPTCWFRSRWRSARTCSSASTIFSGLACSSHSPRGAIPSLASRSGRCCSSTCAPRPPSPSD